MCRWGRRQVAHLAPTWLALVLACAGFVMIGCVGDAEGPEESLVGMRIAEMNALGGAMFEAEGVQILVVENRDSEDPWSPSSCSPLAYRVVIDDGVIVAAEPPRDCTPGQR